MDNRFIKEYDVNNIRLCTSLLELLKQDNVQIIDTSIRNCKYIDLHGTPYRTYLKEFSDLVSKYLSQYIQDIDQVHCGFFDHNRDNFYLTDTKLLQYDQNTSFIDFHVDAWSSVSCHRQISVILYLTDVEDGGATTFHVDKNPFVCKPQKGKLVLFPSNFCFPHKALPPISGIKCVAVTFVALGAHSNHPNEKVTILKS
jgi:hypothetical protein